MTYFSSATVFSLPPAFITSCFAEDGHSVPATQGQLGRCRGSIIVNCFSIAQSARIYKQKEKFINNRTFNTRSIVQNMRINTKRRDYCIQSYFSCFSPTLLHQQTMYPSLNLHRHLCALVQEWYRKKKRKLCPVFIQFAYWWWGQKGQIYNRDEYLPVYSIYKQDHIKGYYTHYCKCIHLRFNSNWKHDRTSL